MNLQLLFCFRESFHCIILQLALKYFYCAKNDSDFELFYLLSSKERLFVPKALWLIIIGNIISVIGGSFLWPLNTIYLNGHLGKSLSLAGVVLMLNSAASVIGNMSGGYLFDKLGGYRAIMFGASITLLSLVGLTFWHDWPHYMIFLIFIGFGSGVVNPAIYAFAGASWKEGGRRAYNAMYVGANVGVAIGTALAGFIADISMEYIFVSNLLLYSIFYIIAFFNFRKISIDNQTQGMARGVAIESTSMKSKENRSRLKALLIVSLGFGLCWVAYVQWQTTIATYTQDINISLKEYSMLWTLNGALIVFAQPLLSRFIKKFSLNLKAQILVGLVIFIGAFGLASVSNSFSGFIAAMIIMTFGEMLVWPAIPTIADMLAPNGKSGLFQGIVNSAATVGRMVGPVLGGVLVDLYGMEVLFITLLGLFVIAILSTLIYDKGLKNKEVLQVHSISKHV